MGIGFLKNLFKKRDSAKESRRKSQDSGVDPVKSQIVINTISDGIAIISTDGIIQLFNPAAEALTGWRADDAVSLDFRSVFNLINNADRPFEDRTNPILMAFRTGRTVDCNKAYIKTASKKKIQLSIKATPIILNDPQPHVEGLVVVFRDITMERAEQNAQTDFISTASHEMRTPVATIEGYLGMIINPAICQIDDRARDYANKAHQSIQHLGRLFQDLLDVTKLDDNRMPSNPELIDVNIAVRDIVSEFADEAEAKHLALKLDLNGSSNPQDGGNRVVIPRAIIYADLDHFDEVLSNMIENAIKYTPKGSVSVKVISDNDRVRIKVSDTGIGIPAEDVPHLFQKFYRVDNGETREIGGTGLGLYLIKTLTTSMGGTAGVESDYGSGSTFWIEFDCLSSDEIAQKAQEIKRRRERQDALRRQKS